MLKPEYVCVYERTKKQPPSGGCVLKPHAQVNADAQLPQPPSGGCVLKLLNEAIKRAYIAAAFRRLCVETTSPNGSSAGGGGGQPPSGGCVLKLSDGLFRRLRIGSRLQAAVC